MSEPHPLAERLIKRLQSRPESRVLDFASGSGRNLEALRRAGFVVAAVSDEAAASDAPLGDSQERFAAVVSTHGLLHGTGLRVAARVKAIAERLEDGGLLYATFGSTSDARFGRGERIGDSTFAPTEGDERGVAHAYFRRGELRALLEPYFEVESLREQRVDEVAGAWAHRKRPLAGAVHWYAIARKR